MGLKDRFTGLGDWLKEGLGTDAGGGGAGSNAGPRIRVSNHLPYSPADVAEHPDPWAYFHHRYDRSRAMVYGTYGDKFLFTPPDSHMLVLGPARKGKTAGVLIPLILSVAGPAVVTSTRKDVIRATGLCRARKGRVWHVDFDTGVSEPGTTPLRFSPITTDFTIASTTAEAMAYAAEVNRDGGGGGTSAGYFAEQATRLLAPTLVAAGLADKTIEWVVDIVLSQDPDRYIEVADVLAGSSHVEGVDNAQRELSGVLNMPGSHGSGADIFATAARAFRVYNRPSVMKFATNPKVASQPRCKGQRT